MQRKTVLVDSSDSVSKTPTFFDKIYSDYLELMAEMNLRASQAAYAVAPHLAAVRNQLTQGMMAALPYLCIPQAGLFLVDDVDDEEEAEEEALMDANDDDVIAADNSDDGSELDLTLKEKMRLSSSGEWSGAETDEGSISPSASGLFSRRASCPSSGYSSDLDHAVELPLSDTLEDDLTYYAGDEIDEYEAYASPSHGVMADNSLNSKKPLR